MSDFAVLLFRATEGAYGRGGDRTSWLKLLRPGGCAPAIWRLATDTVEVDLRHFSRVIRNNINDGQRQFGIVHIYDICILAQDCTASQIGRRLSALILNDFTKETFDWLVQVVARISMCDVGRPLSVTVTGAVHASCVTAQIRSCLPHRT